VEKSYRGRELMFCRTVFYRDPFKFVKGLFNKEKGGHIKATKSEVEEYLRNTYSDQ